MIEPAPTLTQLSGEFPCCMLALPLAILERELRDARAEAGEGEVFASLMAKARNAKAFRPAP